MDVTRHPSPTTRWEARASLLSDYDDLVISGEVSPFLYPWGTIAAGLVFGFLLIPLPRTRLTGTARYIVWTSNTALSLYGIGFSCMRLTLGYAGGLLCAWAILWTTVLLLNHDVQRDFKRIEYLGARKPGEASSRGTKSSNLQQPGLGTFRLYQWEPFPRKSLLKRFIWVADLFTGLRGIGWNWQLPTLAPLPLHVRKQLGEDSTTDTPIGRDGTKRYEDRGVLLRHRTLQLCFCYLFLDLLIVLSVHDPYFWGVVDAPAPAFLPSIIRRSAFLCRAYRNIATMLAIATALQFYFALGPLVFVGLIGRERIGVWGEPWAYPDVWGSFGKVLDHGLIGFWGSWWHQAFRYAFESNANALANALGLDEKSQLSKVARLVFAFGFSGFMHASGSYASLRRSRPFSGAFLFFLLQPFGIMLQTTTSRSLRRFADTARLPKLVRQLSTLMLTYLWLHFTAPLVCDDFAMTGIWMIEPLPISPFRGLGLGDAQDGWWCWRGSWGKWYQGKHWWQTGIAL